MGNLRTALFLTRKAFMKGNKWALVFVILAMSLSFVNLNFMPALLSGARDTLEEQLVRTVLANVVIDPEEDEYYLNHAQQIVQKVREVPGVVGVAPHLNNTAFIEYEWERRSHLQTRVKVATGR